MWFSNLPISIEGNKESFTINKEITIAGQNHSIIVLGSIVNTCLSFFLSL